MATAKTPTLHLGAKGPRMHEPTARDLQRFAKEIKKLGECSQVTKKDSQVETGGKP